MTKVRRNIVFPRANRSREEIWEPDTRRGETRIDPDVPPRGFSVPFRPPPYDCWNRGGTDHGHIGRLLGARGTASRGLRRGTTPATTRSRLPNSATGGEQSVSFSLLSFFLSASSGSSVVRSMRKKRGRLDIYMHCVIRGFSQSVVGFILF